jgi:POLQ-like helicase
MSSYDRDLIEDAFRSGVISIITCTTTLSAGINLPANVAIINGLEVGHRQLYSTTQYQQMVGRAGRMGYSSIKNKKSESSVDSNGDQLRSNKGKSYLVLNKAVGALKMEDERKEAVKIVTSKCEAVYSQINPKVVSSNHGTGTALLKLLIEVIGLNLCKSINNLELFFKNTLFYIEENDLASQISFSSSIEQETINRANIFSDLHSCCKFLEHSKIIEVNVANEISLSKFGKAMFSCNLDIDDSIEFYDRLIQVQNSGINLEEYLHLLTILGK